MVPNDRDVEVAVRCVFTAADVFENLFTAEARMHAELETLGTALLAETAEALILTVIMTVFVDGLEPLRAWAHRHRAYHHPGAAVADHAVGHLRVVERHQPTGDDGNQTLTAAACHPATADQKRLWPPGSGVEHPPGWRSTSDRGPAWSFTTS